MSEENKPTEEELAKILVDSIICLELIDDRIVIGITSDDRLVHPFIVETIEEDQNFEVSFQQYNIFADSLYGVSFNPDAINARFKPQSQLVNIYLHFLEKESIGISDDDEFPFDSDIVTGTIQ